MKFWGEEGASILRDVSYKVIRNGGGYMGRMMKSKHKNMRWSDLKVYIWIKLFHPREQADNCQINRIPFSKVDLCHYYIFHKFVVNFC